MDELQKNQAKKQIYKDYYEGNHAILSNYTMQDSRSNMKLPFNFPRKFVDLEVGYIFSKPVNYISKSGNDAIVNIIDYHMSHWDKEHNLNLRKKSEIFGESYELNYINSEGEFSAAILTPLNSYVLEDGTAQRNVVLALHTYKNKFDDAQFLDVYHQNNIHRYQITSDNNKTALMFIETKTHIFGRVPVITCQANSEKISGFHDIIPLLDAYNNLNSDLCNEISDNRNAYLVIEGAKIDEEDLAKMKQMGIIQCPPGAKVVWLIKEINDTFVQNELENLENKIYDLMDTVNFNKDWASNTSGIALKNKLLNLENRVAMREAVMENVIKQRLKNFFRFLEVKEGKKFDYRDVAIRFTRNLPTDLVGLADVISKLRDLLPDETLISWLPQVENPALEIEKRQKEQSASNIDLDKVPDDDDV